MLFSSQLRLFNTLRLYCGMLNAGYITFTEIKMCTLSHERYFVCFCEENASL